MLLDQLNTFAEAVATGNTGTRILGDVIDLGTVSRDVAAGHPIYVEVTVETAIAAGTNGTYQIVVTHADNAALDSGNVNVLTSASFDAASGIPAGTVLLRAALPSLDYKRYIGVQEVVGTANTSAGAVNAHLTFDLISHKAYAEADK